MELRSILDWDIAFKLRSVPGVVEVNSYGGELKTYEVQVDPDKLISYNISMERLFVRWRRNNANAGGGYIEHEPGAIPGSRRRADRQPRTRSRTSSSTAAEDGTPIYVSNVADVAFAPMVRQGAVTRDGRGEAVTGVVMMLIGENSARRRRTA